MNKATATEAPASTELWLDSRTTIQLLKRLKYGKNTARIVHLAIRAIASSIPEQQEAYPDSALAQIGRVHPSLRWQGARTRWDDPPMDSNPVISLAGLEAILADPLALQMTIDRKPAHLSDETAIILIERFVLRVKQLPD